MHIFDVRIFLSNKNLHNIHKNSKIHNIIKRTVLVSHIIYVSDFSNELEYGIKIL